MPSEFIFMALNFMTAMQGANNDEIDTYLSISLNFFYYWANFGLK